MTMDNKNKFKAWIKRNKLLVIVIVSVVLWVFIPPFINRMITTEAWLFPSFFGYVNSENADSWIGFYGAIIGGTITLLGVAWTIIDQNKNREEDMKDSVKPILVANSHTYEEVTGIEGQAGNRVFECILEYKNVGKGVLFNPMVFNIEYSVDGKELGKLQPTFYVNNFLNVNDVAKNSVMIIFEPDVLSGIVQSLSGRGNTIPLQVVMYVGGKDMFGRDIVSKLEYKTEITFFSTEDIQLPLHGGKLTSTVISSEEEICKVLRNADPSYNYIVN